MAKIGIARGGDEILRPQSFYGSTPARPAALRTVDAEGNLNVGPNKALNILNTPSMFLCRSALIILCFVCSIFSESLVFITAIQPRPGQRVPTGLQVKGSILYKKQLALFRRTMCIELNELLINCLRILSLLKRPTLNVYTTGDELCQSQCAITGEALMTY